MRFGNDRVRGATLRRAWEIAAELDRRAAQDLEGSDSELAAVDVLTSPTAPDPWRPQIDTQRIHDRQRPG